MANTTDHGTAPPARTMGSALATLSILAVEAKARLALGPAPFLSRPALLAFVVDPTGLHRTAAIAIVARHVQVPVHRVDIGTIVQSEESKSNFTQLFLAAERAGVVLYLDHADALFNAPGASAAHPFGRFEADFLMDRLDAFSGVVLAAVYRRELIAPAFVKRARHIVDFTQPTQPASADVPVERNE
jgi:ATPase family protein associated with various cellular activities (AAA)